MIALISAGAQHGQPGLLPVDLGHGHGPAWKARQQVAPQPVEDIVGAASGHHAQGQARELRHLGGD